MDADTTRECGRLVVIAGLPGSGKTTLATHWPTRCRVSDGPDDWMIASGIDLFGIAISDEFYDVDPREGLWVLGVKKNRQDRHSARAGAVEIEPDAVDGYQRIVGA